MKNPKIERAAKFFLSGLIILFIYGIVVAIISHTVAVDTFQRFTGEDASKLDPKYLELLVHQTRMVGLMGAGTVLLVMYILWTNFRAGDKWALIAIFVGGGLTIGTLITLHMAMKAWPLFIVDNIGLFPIGLAFPMVLREFFPKKSDAK